MTQHPGSGPVSEPVPGGWRISPDHQLRRRQAGRLLLGGSPLQVLRLSSRGADRVNQWFNGSPIEPGRANNDLARRLLHKGIAHPIPPIPLVPPVLSALSLEDQLDLTVVIPVKDDPKGLAATLAGLATVPVIIVDDGSATPLTPTSDPNQILVRNPVPVGPGQARNLGLTRVNTNLVAFIDAGVVINYHQLQQLVGQLGHPEVVAVAPRVQSVANADPTGPPAPAGWAKQPRPRQAPFLAARALAHYEVAHSPLDLGEHPARVGPGLPVSYVPSACLLARVSALVGASALPGEPFDPTFRYGEDVDLEWRLDQLGTIRYDPSVVVTHPPRPDLGSFVRQRIGYGSAAAPLARKHGLLVAPFRTSPWSMAVISLVLWRRVVLAGLMAFSTSFLLWRKLGPAFPDREVEAVRLTSLGHVLSARALGETLLRSWWPATLVGLFFPGSRPPLSLLCWWGLWSKVWKTRAAPDLTTLTCQVAIGLVDDASYGAGVWKGAFDERSFRALLPDFGSAFGARLARWA